MPLIGSCVRSSKAILACPIGMGAMMWFMAKGMKGQSGQAQAKNSSDAQSAASIDQLRREQARLSAEVERLERERSRDGEPISQG